MRQSGPLVLAALAVSACVFAAPAARGDEPEWYAGIEIGSKGVKMVALPVDGAGRPDLRRVAKAVNNVTLKDLKDGKFRRAAVSDVRAAVKEFYEQLTLSGAPKRPKVKPENVWVVASSGVTMKRPPNFGEVVDAVREATGGAKALKEISQAREVELLMRGAIPPEQWENSVLVDVGSGNVKCGYIYPKRGEHVERPYVPDVDLEGTVSYRQSIEKEMKREGGSGFRRFLKVAEQRRDRLAEDVADELGRYPGLASSGRRRVYLSGGSPYAIASLLHPVEMARDDVTEVRFTVAELLGFIRSIQNTEAVSSPDLARLSGPDRALAEAKVKEVLDIFKEKEELLSGAEILLGFNNALHWDEQGKEIYFTKSGLVAWIVGFVAEERGRASVAPGR